MNEAQVSQEVESVASIRARAEQRLERHQRMMEVLTTALGKSTPDCIKALSETDFTEDLKKFDVPTLVLHGDDPIVPIAASALASSKLVVFIQVPIRDTPWPKKNNR